MKLKKWIALASAALMLIALAACDAGGGSSGGGSTSGGKKGEPIDLVIYSQTANFSGEMNGWGAEILREKFNVNITIINDGVDGTFQTRMEAGDLGDIVIFGSDGNDFKDASEAGMLLDWEEDELLEEYGPYIYEHFPFALEKNKNINGTMHGFGHGVAGNANDHAAFYYYPHIRWDLYVKLGMPEINTLEDFIPVLEQMVALEPTTDIGTKTYGVSSFTDWDGDMVMMVKSTAALYGWEESHFGLYDTKTQVWEDCLKEGGWYERCLRFYNKLFQKGLFDPDSSSQNWPDLTEKYTNGAAMFNIFEWIGAYFNNDEHDAQGKRMMPVVAKDQINLADGISVYGSNRLWTIGSKTNYPELCMEIINWFCTPEGVLSYNFGPKGVTWELDEDGEPYMTELGLQCQEDQENTELTYRDYSGTYRNGEFQHNNTTWALDAVNPESPSGNTYNYKFWPSTILTRKVSEVEQSWRDWSGYVLADDFLTANGHKSVRVASTYVQSRKGSELQATWTQLQTCIQDGSWNAIYAKDDAEFEAILAKMRKDAYDYGFQDCVDWCEAEAIIRRDAENAAMGR
ncbi:MAG: extracellular solute-binding protein [Oscillospiraceae bacterium]|nr:extracellular solute-binding protein [Oscillospiraceae bacterium]